MDFDARSASQDLPAVVTYLLVFMPMIATIAIAIATIFGVFYARQQYKINLENLKLELFNRRYEVYEAAKHLISQVFEEGRPTNDEINKYIIATRESDFLYDDQVAQYLRELGNRATKIQSLATRLNDPSDLQSADELHETFLRLKTEFISEGDTVKGILGPFLSIRHEENPAVSAGLNWLWRCWRR